LIKDKNKTKKSLLILINLANKASDSLDRKIALNKLDCLGVNNISLNWFKSYLSDRQHIFSLKGFVSDVLENKYGVIQGSTLGPLLFLAHQNNLAKIN
jgi:hypothetical protein